MIFERINQWNIDRGTDKKSADGKLMSYCIVEELLELVGVNKDTVDLGFEKVLANSYSLSIQAEGDLINAKPTDEEQVDALCDIIVFASGFIQRKGYDPEKCMEQTLLEIESRLQCPEQALRWKEKGSNGEKWQKDKNQSTDTMYKARYSECKLKKN